MIKVLSKSSIIGSGNEQQAFQSLANKIEAYLAERQLAASNVQWLQSSTSGRVILTAIIGE